MIREVVTRVAPLGIRFWDDARGELVRDGLRVTARPEPGGRAVGARVNGAGVWSCSDLAGLRAASFGRGDATWWAAIDAATPPVRRAFVVDVEDTERRFLPVRLRVEPPIQKVYDWAPMRPDDAVPASSGAPRGAVPLFSSPARRFAERAALRVELVDATTDRAVAGALLEVRLGAALLGRGLSDREGRALVLFAPPEPPDSGLGSPPGGLPSDWRWNLDLTVRASPPPDAPPRVAPMLDDIFAQPTVTALGHLSPEAPLGPVELRAGVELIVRSTDDPRGRLRVRTSP
jgi:hypothetical protein